MNKLCLIVIVAACLMTAVPAKANRLVNGNFEDGQTGSGVWGVGQDGANDAPISPWQTDHMSAGSNWEIQLHTTSGATIGDYALIIFWIRNWVYQDFDVTEGEKYALGNKFLSSPLMAGYMTFKDEVISVQWYDPCDVQILTGEEVGIDLDDDGVETDMYAIEVDRFQGGPAGDPQDVWVSKGGVVQAPAGAVKGRYIITQQLTSRPDPGSAGGAHIDEAYVVSAAQARAPNPADGSVVGTTTDELSWIQPEAADPCDTVICSVYFACMTDGDPNVLIASGDIDSVTLSEVGITLEDEKEYHWAVDCNDTGTLITTEGPRWWTFSTGNGPPVVSVGGDSYIWLTMDDGDTDANNVVFELTAEVTDDGKPSNILNYLWEVTGADSSIQTIEWLDPNTNPSPRVKFFATGDWSFELTVDDTNLTGWDEGHVIVYGSACEAAMADPADEPLAGDINGDCETNILDLLTVAESWLQCMSDKLIGIKPECTP